MLLRMRSSQHLTPLESSARKLVDDGTLVLRDARFRFSRNVLFATPSSAASVVLGRSANGRVELLDQAGRTLKYLEESVVVA